MLSPHRSVATPNAGHRAGGPTASLVQQNQMASFEIVRDLNRRVVLDRIRNRQPLSRADIARSTGLTRSTISCIVDELVDERWVTEGPGRLPLGRRPTLLRLNDRRVIISVDVHRSRIVVGVADLTGSFLIQETVATSSDPMRAIKQIVHQIQKAVRFSKGKEIEGVGISVPGRWNREANSFSCSSALNWPRTVDIRTPVVEATGLDVELENAANASVLGAVFFDEVDRCRNVVAVSVREGIDVGIFADGRLVRGLDGMAGEFGHVSLDPNGPACECGGVGCWSVLASDVAALRRYFGPGGPPDDVSLVDLLRLAEGGDARAVHAIGIMARDLGRGMRMIVAALAPERIMVIGDLAGCWHYFGPVIEREIAGQMPAQARVPRVVPVLDSRMALRGAVALVMQQGVRCGPVWRHLEQGPVKPMVAAGR